MIGRPDPHVLITPEDASDADIKAVLFLRVFDLARARRFFREGHANALSLRLRHAARYDSSARLVMRIALLPLRNDQR